MTKVGVCVPSGGTVHAAFEESLALLIASSQAICVLINTESSVVAVNRDNAVKAARGAGCSHVLFLDSDMVFPSWALDHLLARGKDIVGCVYPRRVAPYNILGSLMGVPDCSDLRQGFELGMGCMLIDVRVFDRLEAPYFRMPAIPSFDKVPAELAGFDLAGYEPPTLMGEDYYFCKAARRAGFTVWADMPLSMELGHIGTVVHRIPR
jgi:hypothetical protein